MAIEMTRIGVRVALENVQLNEKIDNIVRNVYRQSVTIESDNAFVAYVVAGTATVAVVGLTAYWFTKKFGDRGKPLAPSCVIYEVTVPKSEKKRLEEYSDGSLKKDLQKFFSNVEDELRQVLGEEYTIDPEVLESLKKTKIASVELCDQQKLQEAWKKFWQIQDTKATEATNPVTLNKKVKRAFGGEISESKLNVIIQAFKDVGVNSPDDVALLTTNDIAKQLEGALTLVELRKLNEFVKGHEMPLPPSGIRLSSGEYPYPNTGLTVFFDDPNKMACKYMVTAQDMESTEEIPVEFDANFGVLKNLLPGRRYVISAQCISNGVKSKKTFFSEPIIVYGGKDDSDASTGTATYPTKQFQGVQSAPSITDSGYPPVPSRTGSDRDPRADGASVSTKSEIELGEEAETKSKQAEGLPILWKSQAHDVLKIVFPGMPDAKMMDLLKKFEEIGIQKADDLQYLKEPDVAVELKGTLKIVESKKLLKYVKEEEATGRMLRNEISIGGSGRPIVVDQNLSSRFPHRKNFTAQKMAVGGGTLTTIEHGTTNTLAVQIPSGNTSAEGAKK